MREVRPGEVEKVTEPVPFYDLSPHCRYRLDEVELDEVVGGVYFIQAGEGQNAPIKIGWSDDVGKRFAALQCAHYEELHVRLICGGVSRDEHQRLEKTLHHAYRGLRIRGEWFRPGWTLVRLVEEPAIGAFRMLGFKASPRPPEART